MNKTILAQTIVGTVGTSANTTKLNFEFGVTKNMKLDGCPVKFRTGKNGRFKFLKGLKFDVNTNGELEKRPEHIEIEYVVSPVGLTDIQGACLLAHLKSDSENVMAVVLPLIASYSASDVQSARQYLGIDTASAPEQTASAPEQTASAPEQTASAPEQTASAPAPAQSKGKQKTLA